jgi:hypothetical protein
MRAMQNNRLHLTVGASATDSCAPPAGEAERSTDIEA